MDGWMGWDWLTLNSLTIRSPQSGAKKSPLQSTLISQVVLQANQHWDAEADALVKNDLERTQSLFLAAPSVSRRVNKLKVDIIMINFIRGSFVIFKMNIYEQRHLCINI